MLPSRPQYGKDYDYDSPVQLLHKMCHGVASYPGEQVVVLSQVLVTDITVGYEVCRRSSQPRSPSPALPD